MTSRLPALVLLLLAAGCDSAIDAPDPGAFTASLRGDASGDLAGAAALTLFDEGPPMPDGGFFQRAVVTLDGGGSTITLTFYEPPRARTYVLSERPSDGGAPTLLSARIDGDPYISRGGTVRVTRSTGTEVEGEFDARISCCGNSFANVPGKEARVQGRFVAVIGEGQESR